MATATQRNAVLSSISHLPATTQANIRANMRLGLLCACNRTRVPYFAPVGSKEEHGTRTLGRLVHGYYSCDPK